MTEERKFVTDCTVRLEGDSFVFTFMRGETGDDIAEICAPAAKAVHAAVALFEIHFGRVRAAKIQDRLHLEWEAAEWERAQGHLAEAERSDFDEVVP